MMRFTRTIPMLACGCALACLPIFGQSIPVPLQQVSPGTLPPALPEGFQSKNPASSFTVLPGRTNLNVLRSGDLCSIPLLKAGPAATPAPMPNTVPKPLNPSHAPHPIDRMPMANAVPSCAAAAPVKISPKAAPPPTPEVRPKVEPAAPSNTAP